MARSREDHKHPKQRFAHGTAAWASLWSNGEAETKKKRCCFSKTDRAEEEWKRFGDGRTSDEKALASRPPCGDTVTKLCGPDACSAAPASPDQGLTVRCRRQSTLETARAIAEEAWMGGSLGGLQRAAACRGDWAGLARCVACMYEYSRATGLYHWAVPRGTYREGAERMLVERRAGPSRLDGVQSAGARASCSRRGKWPATNGRDIYSCWAINMCAYVGAIGTTLFNSGSRYK